MSSNEQKEAKSKRVIKRVGKSELPFVVLATLNRNLDDFSDIDICVLPLDILFCFFGAMKVALAFSQTLGVHQLPSAQMSEF